ncbi:Holin, partial [Dysosmobacter welbionis]
RHRQPGLLRPVGPAGRDLVPGGGVLLRLPPGGTAEDRRRVCPGPAGAGGGQGDHKGDRGPVGGKLHRGAAA